MRREWADKAPFIDTTNGALRDVAQLVARVLWEHDAAGSSPVISTKALAKLQGLYFYAKIKGQPFGCPFFYLFFVLFFFCKFLCKLFGFLNFVTFFSLFSSNSSSFFATLICEQTNESIKEVKN